MKEREAMQQIGRSRAETLIAETQSERDALIAAVVAEYAAALARRGAWEKPAILGQAEQSCYLHGVESALERVAARLGVADLHARAADVLARGEEGGEEEMVTDV